ncbi:hypothetical protein TUM12151_23370 [Morganella morganii]|nr:hypothetical protein TUM12149_01750 [Morganella morganii]GIZ30739.1 hypothetical protein TUM12150_12250 [Morganella morganii]GIZ35351.1 hypothetical protein TUM12151_23370 [Morganella morganii]
MLLLTGSQAKDRNNPGGMRLTDLIASRYYFYFPQFSVNGFPLHFPAEFFPAGLRIFAQAESLLFLP